MTSWIGCARPRTRACRSTSGELDNLIGILHMKRVAQELARGTLTRERLMRTRGGARALLRARGHPADAAAGAVPAHAPPPRLRRQRVRRYRRPGDARGHPRGDRRRIHQRSGHGDAQGRAARRRRQLAGQRQRDDPRAQSLARLAAAGRSGRARSMACCSRSSRPSRRRAPRCASATTTSRCCRSPTTRFAPCACARYRREKRRPARPRTRRPGPRSGSQPAAVTVLPAHCAASCRAAG